jgi:hypothetical protein
MSLYLYSCLSYPTWKSNLSLTKKVKGKVRGWGLFTALQPMAYCTLDP